MTVFEQGSLIWWFIMFLGQSIIWIFILGVQLFDLKVENLSKTMVLVQVNSVLYFFLLLIYCISTWEMAEKHLWAIGMLLAFCSPIVGYLAFFKKHTKEVKI